MGIDVVTALAVVGTVQAGNPVSLNPGLSIGGISEESSNILGNLEGLLGKPRGLDGTHNVIEADSSATRNDLYATGNAHTMNMTLFRKFLASGSGKDGIITMANIAQRATDRFYESVATNPTFYYGPYTGTIARNAGYMFLGRLLSNHTREQPYGGHLSREVLCSFYGVSQDKEGRLVYEEGHERIPENWYRIAVDYGFAGVSADLVDWVTRHPVLLSVGGNLGTVDSFAGVDVADLTGGVLDATKLLEGNNLVCFALTVLRTFTPNSLSTAFKLLEGPLKLVNDALLDPLLDLSCPAFGELTMGGEDLWTALLDRYPGAEQSGRAL
jgi:hypothetical protein